MFAGGEVGDRAMPSTTAYFHPKLSKTKCEELLAENDGLNRQGKYLFRPKSGGGGGYVLSVVYKGKATHHTIIESPEGDGFLLNNSPTGQSTLGDLAK